MSDRREASARAPGAPGAAGRVTPAGPAADRERVLLLECRLEQMRAALGTAREEADRARTKLAEASAREADHARRYGLIHEELAEARAEIAALHRHLERSEALRAEIAGHLFEAGAREDIEELVRLRQKVLAEDQRALVSDRTVARLRERVQELVSSRETLLTRIAEWQQLIREDGPEAADLSEFLAELRGEILDLEHRNLTGDAREAALRERLALAGIDPDREPARPAPTAAPEEEAQAFDQAEEGDEAPAAHAAQPSDGVDGRPEPEASMEAGKSPMEAAAGGAPEAPAPEAPAPGAGMPEDEASVALEQVVVADPAEEPRAAEPPRPPAPTTARPTPARTRTDALMAELRRAGGPTFQADLLLELGRSGEAAALDAIRPWTGSSEPSVRAAAYEALGRLLERTPSALEPHLRAGLADPDARVRRRVVLAAATARGLLAHALLDPLQDDPDPQVRRVVRQVLRQAPSATVESGPPGARAPRSHKIPTSRTAP
jgi:HEAT repeats